jgi:transcription initiation factor IIE alpha subunit
MLQMPQTRTRKRNPDGLTTRGKKIVEILRKRGDWMTRNEIADSLNLRSLSYHDRDILDRLQEAGYIVIDKHIRDDMVAEYIYQATNKQIEDKS